MEDLDWMDICPECNRQVKHSDMSLTFDCHGIPFRSLCFDCWQKVMSNGFDGEYYDECDECLDEDY